MSRLGIIFLASFIVVVFTTFTVIKDMCYKYNHDGIVGTANNANVYDKTQQQRNGIVDSSFLDRCVMDFEDDDIKPFELVPGWEWYRLGDCIKLCQGCANGSKIKNGTFAADYFQHHCPGDRSNLTAIEEVFQRRIDSLQQQQQQQQQQSLIVSPYDILTVPDPDVLVIHLRLGDVIENSAASVEQMLLSGADPAHNINFKSSIKSVHEVLANIQESGLSKVSLRGGSHQANYYVKSRVYAGCLKKAIQHAGYQVQMSLDRTTPDQDFYYMSHATHIVVSTGGYSRLIGKLVQKRGGTIVGRTFRYR
jgi:hypothetical protein